jgi:general secretion pathway protein N
VKRGIAIALVAAAAFAIGMILRFPAAWILPEQTQKACASLDGSLWSGTCAGLTLSGTQVGDLSWKLRPLRLLAGALAARVSVAHGAAQGAADVELGFGGQLTARNLIADLPLDARLIPGVPPSLHGRAHLDLALVQLSHGIIRQLQGRIEARDLVDRSGADTPLGSYQVTFAGSSGDPVGELRDTSGPLALEGTLRLTPQPGFELNGLIAPRRDAPPELVNNIRFLGSPDASGRRSFSLAGTF